MTTKISADNIQTATLATIGGGPKITQILICDSSYVTLDDTAISLNGGYIKIIGSGFKTGATVTVNKTAASSVTFISATELRAQVGAQVAATYIVYVVNSDGGVALRVNGLTYSSEPAWVSGGTLTSGDSGTAISIQLSATSATTYALQAGSTLPTGLALSSGGLISGTVTVSIETLYNFTIVAIDAELQDSPRSFSITITVGDAYFNSTTLLLSGSANTFVKDASDNNFAVTVVGDTKPNNFNPYLSNWSTAFASSGDKLNITGNNAALGTVFTIEMWVYPVSAPSDLYYYVGGSSSGPIIGYNGTTFAVARQGGWELTSSVNPTVGAWNHIAVVREGTGTNQYKLYVNGVLTNTGTSTTVFAAQTSGVIGGLNANISNFRIVDGTALYTAAFTPPTAPLTAITNTTLLTCNNNRFIDTSASAVAMTLTGTPKIQSFSPFVEPATTRGSAYFDGTGDSLYLTSNAAFNLGAGDFTIEMWVNLDVTNINGQYFFYSTGFNPNMFLWGTGAIYLRTEETAGEIITPTASGIVAGTWTHVACVRSGNIYNVYINGNLLVSGTSTGVTNANSELYFGKNLKGYISNFRVVKGTAAYTTAFTPPTAPLTAITNTSLLTLQNNTPVANNTFLDSSSNNLLVTRAGNATQGTLSPYSSSGWSNYFNGSTDYLTTPTSFGFGTGDFTIECWFNTNSINNAGSAQTLIWLGGNTSAYAGVRFGLDTSGLSFYISLDGATWAVNTGAIGTVVSNTWNHAAVTRSGNSFKVFLNGTQVGTTYTQAGTLYAGTLNYIGSLNYTAVSGTPFRQMNGYISNVRIIKGTAVYTANFTPGTTPLTAVAGTSLLTCADNRFIDESPNNFVITRVGDTRVTNFSPFKAVVQTPQTYSAYFDGASDYLRISNTSLVLNNSAFTISFWFYPMTSSVIGLFDSAYGTASTFRNYPANTIGDQNDGSVAFTAITAQWNWMSIVGTGSTFTVYLNGSSVGSASYASLVDLGFSIGTINSGGDGSFNGYISNFRIKNIASVDAVPTAPLTAVSGTTFLTCQSATFVDNSTNKFAITVAGNTRPVTVNPFGSTFTNSTGYTAAEYSGSMYFTNKTDYLAIPATTAVTTFPGNFTFECWVYPTNAAVTYWGIWDARQTGSTAAAMIFNLVPLASAVSGSYRMSYYNGTTYTGTGVVVMNQWTHVAFVRVGTTLTFYINGVAGGTATVSGTQTAAATTNPIYIGSKDSNLAAYGTVGYISNFRVNNGIALYTAAFVPPLAPVLPVANTTLLLNGTSAAITDATTKNDVETIGDAKISTAVSKFGGSSMSFDGTGDYLTTASNPALRLLGNFTMEAWVYLTAGGVACGFVSTYLPNTTYGTILGMTSANMLIFRLGIDAGGFQVSDTVALVTGVWYHIAGVRSGNTMTLYKNGVSVGSVGSVTYTSDTTSAVLGRYYTNTDNFYLNGYIQDARITNGIARYTANFTAPTTAFNTK